MKNNCCMLTLPKRLGVKILQQNNLLDSPVVMHPWTKGWQNLQKHSSPAHSWVTNIWFFNKFSKTQLWVREQEKNSKRKQILAYESSLFATRKEALHYILGNLLSPSLGLDRTYTSMSRCHHQFDKHAKVAERKRISIHQHATILWRQFMNLLLHSGEEEDRERECVWFRPQWVWHGLGLGHGKTCDGHHVWWSHWALHWIPPQ